MTIRWSDITFKGDEHPKDSLSLELMPDNTVSLSFAPVVTGDHLVYIYKNGQQISGSPFTVRAEGPKPPDSSKVKLIGEGKLIKINQWLN